MTFVLTVAAFLGGGYLGVKYADVLKAYVGAE